MTERRGETAAAHAWQDWLGERLRTAGYDGEVLGRRLGAVYPDDIGLLNHAPALQRLADDHSAGAVLTRLFFLEADEPMHRVRVVFSAAECAALLRARLLLRQGTAVRARMRIDPVGGQHYLSDRRFRAADRGALGIGGRDPVYAPGSDSLLLRDALVPLGSGACVLDLCTGSGIQAVQHAGAARVVGVDINPRAAAVARLNAALNGAGNIEVRTGNLYAPVRGERFDRIVANPPFVTSPYTSGPAYHAGGPSGDRVLRRVIAGWGAHLNPGGRAGAVSHVALRGGDDLATVARRWLDGFPGRALVLTLESGTPVDLAAAQALFALRRGLAAYAAEVRRWVAYLRRHRVAAVSAVLVIVERGDRRGLDVAGAERRVLPIPLTPAPAQRVGDWLAS